MDNDRLVLETLSRAFAINAPDWTVFWLCDSGYDVIDKCSHAGSTPSLLLADLSMGDISGLRVCRTLRREDPTMVMVAMTSFDLESYARQAAESGMQGIVAKSGISVIIKAVNDAFEGMLLDSGTGVTFDTPHTSYLRLRNSSVKELPARETQIVDQCARGKSYIQIAASLGIGETSVRTYIERTRLKLGAVNRQELIARWLGERRIVS